MDRGPWQVTVHGVARVGHDLATKPPPPPPPFMAVLGFYYARAFLQLQQVGLL